MEARLEAPSVFCTRPPSCLVLLDDESLASNMVDKIFNDEVQAVQGRLREQMSQLRTELGLFLRLMYKNKNQHRRSLYYQRLSEVRRNLQMLSIAGLDEIVECFAKMFCIKRPDGVSSKIVIQSKFKDAIDEKNSVCTLLYVARLLNQSDGPIMAGSAQLAGLLGQSFFMPFALTMFSCLARFRVLLIQILYEVITSYNLLSAFWRRNQKLCIYSATRKSVSATFISRNFPVELECQWDGVQLAMTEKRLENFTEGRVPRSDVPAEPSQFWFVDDRTGVKYELHMPATIAGPSREQPSINSRVTLDASKGTFRIPTRENLCSHGPNLDGLPETCSPGPSGDIARPSAEDYTTAKEMNDSVENISAPNSGPDLFGKSSMSQSRLTNFSGLGTSITGRDHRRASGTNSAISKNVAYRPIRHRTSLDSTCTMNNSRELGNGGNGVDKDMKYTHVKGPPLDELRINGDKEHDLAYSILTIPPSCNSRDLGMLESDVANRDPVEIELNHQRAKSSMQNTPRQSDAGRVDFAAGVSGSVIMDEVKDTRKVSGGGVTAKEDPDTGLLTKGEVRTKLEPKVECLSPECTGVPRPNEGLASTSPNHDIFRHDLLDSGGVSASHLVTKDSKGGVDDDFCGNGDFGADKPLFSDSVSSSTSFDDADNHGLKDKLEIFTVLNRVDVDAALETYTLKDELQNVGPDGPVAYPSLSKTYFEFHMVGPGPSEVINAFDSSTSSGNDTVLNGSESCILANTDRITHSNGKGYLTVAGAGDSVGICPTRLPKKPDAEQVSEQILENNASAPISNSLQDATGGERGPVADVSISSRREKGSKVRPQQKGIASNEKSQQQLVTGLNCKTSGLKRGNANSEGRSSESESKRKKANDIFVMLLGGAS